MMGAASIPVVPLAQPPKRTLIVPLVVWLLLYGIFLLAHHHTFYRTSPVLVRLLQVAPAAMIVETVSPGLEVIRLPDALAASQIEMRILKGCDGTEAWLMLLAAFIAFPAPLGRRLLGMLWGTAIVFGLNQLRIVTLFLIALHRMEWFEIAHGVVWQSVMVISVALFVLLWMRPAPLAFRSGEERT